MKKRLINLLDFYEEENPSKENSSPSLSTSSKKIKKASSQSSLDRNMKNTPKGNKGKKNPWQPAEDEKVMELIGQFGQSWAQIANALGNRTGKQVRDRYLNYLRPDIKGEDFTQQEEQLLLSLYYQFGHRWSKIASYLQGRTECQVKNWYYTHIKKRIASEPNNKDFSAIKECVDKRISILKEGVGKRIFNKSEEKKEYEMKEENPFKREDNHMSQESSDTISERHPEVHFQNFTLNDPTDVISYDNPNNIVFVGPSLRNSASSMQPIHVPEKCQPQVFRKPFEELPQMVDQMGSSYNDQFVKCSQFMAPGMSLTEEQLHRQVLPNFESVFENKERSQRYEELVRMKNALEFFYTKTLQEMTYFERKEASLNHI